MTGQPGGGAGGWSRGAAVAVAAAALLAVAALAGRAILAPPEPRPTPTPRVTTPAPFPSNEVSFDLQLPLTTTDVAGGKQVTIEGTGPRQIAYRVTDGSMVAARLDCAHCSGLLSFVAGNRATPLFSGTGPWAGAFLFNDTPQDRRTLLRVDAVGKWIITLTSVHDLTATPAPLTGTGPAVVLLDAPGAGLTVAATDASGTVHVTAHPAARRGGTDPSGAPTQGPVPSPTPLPVSTSAVAPVFAEGGGRTVTLDMPLPAVVAIEAAGPWRLTANS